MLSPHDARLAVAAVALVVVVAASGAGYKYVHEKDQLRERAETITGGDARHGEALFMAYGCGGCHTLTGVPQAHGKVGPPLDTIGVRAIIAGKLDNTPDNLERWIENPQAVSPGTAMPYMGVKPDQARDLAAFLYTRS